LKGDPVTRGQAQWLTTLYATQVRLQAGRVTARGRTRADVLKGADTVTLAPQADRVWEAELGLLLGALVSFKKTLLVIAQSGFDNAAILMAVHDEFESAIPDLAEFRNAMVHGEDWVRGQGLTRQGQGKYLGTSTLLSGPTNPNRDLCIVRFHHEGVDRQMFFDPDQSLQATERAMAALAGKRRPGDPDESPISEEPPDRS